MRACLRPIRPNGPRKRLLRTAPLLAAVVTVVLVAACGGGGGGGGNMVLESVSVAGNSNWQINRPILFVFSEDVDFSSVNMNSIHIGETTGGTAVGEFSLVDPKTVKFQPRCPTLPDNSDAGLLPGGVSYTVQVPGEGTGGSSVHSISGKTLADTLTIQFTTVASTDPAVLFIDTKAGPPSPVIRRSADDTTPGSYIEIGDDPDTRQYFITRTPVDVNLGLGMPEDPAFVSGLNLYSEIPSHVSLVVAVDQAVRASPDNINSNTVQLEYLSGTTNWISVAHRVTLVANCTGTGALLRVSPSGILPQNHQVRVRFASEFKDIVGNANIVPVVIASFLVGTATDPGTATPGPEGDEFKEEFAVGGESPVSFEDTTTTLVDPRADWGNSGQLKAGFSFSGTGGQGGHFDWKVGNDTPLSPTNHPEIVLDTAFTVITNSDSSLQQNVVGGVVDIHDFTVTDSGTLTVHGPNPCLILVSGKATINGRINLVGASNLSVGTLDTTGQTESGALGTAGGGNGGNGNPLTTQSSPKGANGNGAFNVLGRGGVGGESAYQPGFPQDGDDSHRRPAGGGGGTLGHDSLRPAGINSGYTNTNQCPDQALIGFDAEPGFQGYPGDTGSSGAIGVITRLSPPQGGAAGPRPFLDTNPNNDFWGTMLDNTTVPATVVTGELPRAWAGAGGGGGGNAINSNQFPTTPFDPTGDEKGAGGGGGGGGLTILALGDIVFGAHGRIDASGGTGGGGENSLQTGDVTHIGGGSGGGSGGHIVLQTASSIDFTALTDTVPPPPGWVGGLFALGGEGGAGKNNVGGAKPLGQSAGPCNDALPPNSYPSTNTNTPCRMVSGTSSGLPGYSCNNIVGDPGGAGGGDFPLVVICAGGDGGPGLIQLHAPADPNTNLPNIKIPAAPYNIYKICKPPPVGSFPGSGVPSYAAINSPALWNRLLPIFGRKSQAISKWISLGDASVSADTSSTTPDPIQLFFRGTDAASGNIVSTGGQVAELPPVLSGTIQDSPAKPYIDTDLRTIVFDSTTIVDADDIYLRNVSLFRRFLVRLNNGTAFDFEVGTATFDPVSNTLRLTVSASGSPLQGFSGASVEVRPRFFRVITDDTPQFLPATSLIKAEFQATQPDFQGNPSTDAADISAWTTDITNLSPNISGHPNYRFIRFRISFDISANGDPLTPETPIPGLDFVRATFRF
jgi:hypothetical protein